MDGTSRQVLHSTNLQLTYALAIDYDTQTLYWADYNLNKLETSGVDGSNRRLLSSSLRDPFAMVFFEGTLYWTDWAYNGIYSTQTSSPSTITALLSLGADPYGVSIYEKSVQNRSKFNFFVLFV